MFGKQRRSGVHGFGVLWTRAGRLRTRSARVGRSQRLPARTWGRALAMIAVGASMGTACSSNGPVRVKEDPLLKTLRAEVPAKPLPWRIALGPISVVPRAFQPRPEAPNRRPAAIDAPTLRVALLSALGATEMFEQVTALSAFDDRELEAILPGLDGQRRPPVPIPEVLDAAYRARFDAVLSIEIDRFEVGYVGRNGWFIPNLLNFFTWIWPSWFVADERYGASISVTATLRAPGSGAVLWRKALRGRATRDLDHFERGWKLFGIFSVPGSLDDDDYARVADVVLPYARVDLGRRLVVGLRRASKKLASEATKRRRARTLALLVGVGRYAPGVDDLRPAADDADSVRLRLTEGATAVAAPRTVTTLLDTAATAEGIRRGLDELATRARPEDTVLFYFAGYGATDTGSPALIPHDANPEDPKTWIRLSEVAERLKKVSAGRKIALLDTSFAGPEGAVGRTLYRRDLAGEGADAARIEGSLATISKTLPLWLAASANEVAVNARLEKRGLFTLALEQAVGEAEDENEDGRLSVQELLELVRDSVSERAGKRGVVQTPQTLGAATQLPLLHTEH